MEQHPHLAGAFGTMDGLSLPVQTSQDQEIENATYNGWLSEHFVSCVLVYSAKCKLDHSCELSMSTNVKIGEIIGCNLNVPGSWHDSCVAKPIYHKL
jgi:hypothetical protein